MPRMPVNAVTDADLARQIESDRAEIAALARQLAYLRSRDDREVMHAKTRRMMSRSNAIQFLTRQHARRQGNLDALLREQVRRTRLN